MMRGLKGQLKTMRYRVDIPADVLSQVNMTVALYRSVVVYYLAVIQEHQDVLDNPAWLHKLETLTHRTKDNPEPVYEFDELFPNYPSGMRRAAIAEAYGSAKAWRSSYRKWQGRREKLALKNVKRLNAGKSAVAFKEHPPLYPDVTLSWLGFYGSECRIIDPWHIKLKLYTGSSYVYRMVRLIDPLNAPEGFVLGSPVLVHQKHWELRVPAAQSQRKRLQKVVDIIKNPGYRICSVDLGITNHAAITIQDAEGRVLAVKIIKGAKDSHLRKRLLSRIKQRQSQTGVIPEGESFANDLWRKIRNFNDNLAHNVSRQIVDFAVKQDARVLVFEHLGNLKPIKGNYSRRMNHRLGYWVKGRIFNYSKYKAALEGITTCRVSPQNTSRFCPYCGDISIERYGDKGWGTILARCTNGCCDRVNADFIGSCGIGAKFRSRFKPCLGNKQAS